MDLDLKLARHSLLVMLVALLGGFGWAFALLEQVSISPLPFVIAESIPGEAARWKSVHVGGLLNGIMGLAFAALLPRFKLTDVRQKRITLALIITIWGNMVFYLANLFAPNRSLSLGDNALGSGSVAGNIGYVVAMIAAFALIYAIILLLLSFKGEDS